jgi:hypothetical protein
MVIPDLSCVVWGNRQWFPAVFSAKWWKFCEPKPPGSGRICVLRNQDSSGRPYAVTKTARRQMHAMPLPFVIVDQNQIRCADVIAAAMEQCQQEQLQLLIPDGAAFEFSKIIAMKGDPFLTWKKSLHVIARFSNYVVVGRKITHLWKEEFEQGVPAVDIVDNGATELFRTKLCQIDSGSEKELRSFIDGTVMRLMPESLDLWSNHEHHKVMMRTVRNSLKSQLAEETIKDLRSRTAAGIVDWLSSIDGAKFVYRVIQASGASPEIARLAVEPSVYGGYVTGMVAMGLYWLAFGGLEEAKPEAFANDLHDLEYGILGALSHSLLTADKRLKVIHEAIKGGSAGREKWFARTRNVGPEKA